MSERQARQLLYHFTPKRSLDTATRTPKISRAGWFDEERV
jgi:hypothetical protein